MFGIFAFLVMACVMVAIRETEHHQRAAEAFDAGYKSGYEEGFIAHAILLCPPGTVIDVSPRSSRNDANRDDGSEPEVA